MNDLKIIYDSPTKLDSIFIKKQLKKKYPVWVIEPFHAYHHKKGLRFFPPHLPAFVQELIQHGEVSVLKADGINAREIYLLAADKAVDVVESVYPEYRKRFEKIFSYVSDTLRSPIAENVFKNNSCRLGILHCVAAYPTPLHEANLKLIGTYGVLMTACQVFLITQRASSRLQWRLLWGQGSLRSILV
jgi:hypothetical protein